MTWEEEVLPMEADSLKELIQALRVQLAEPEPLSEETRRRYTRAHAVGLAELRRREQHDPDRAFEAAYVLRQLEYGL